MTAPLIDRRPWHEGEIAARRMAGAPETAPVIRTFLSAQQADFFARLPMVFVAGLDAKGAPIASLLRGAPGFVACPEPRRMAIAAPFPESERLSRDIGAPFGVIGVDFAARQRNRVNGHIAQSSGETLTLAVEEAFGNCPKYISPHAFPDGGGAPGAWTMLPALDGAARDLVEAADVFFLATRGPDGVDISHRGGPSGFIAMRQDGGLLIPDFPGNNYFNSFGNLLHDPRATLLFVDFPTGRALRLQGAARVDFAPARMWTFTPDSAARLETGARSSALRAPTSGGTGSRLNR
ncbi:pyridoxamine 5'-phosphate oxidase family protein [Rhodoblastus sp.]|uniref:pyridoxamine 5'-phosphate oxidase family protein n=1 Tax=Rhodoblastus sp. TaxID=1962975 RepID=UPI00261C07CC|nr:pyridoxamine 5'-phosphate oxidase family protein [Rhodoblastus sp.]